MLLEKYVQIKNKSIFILLIILFNCISLPLISYGKTPDDKKSEPVNVLKTTLAENEAYIENPMGNFFNYKVEGVCIWMHMTWHGPSFTTTLYVTHYLPDLMATVFPSIGQDPEILLNTSIDKLSVKAGEESYKLATGQSTGDGSSAETPENSVNRFFEVNIIGNPAIYAFKTGLPTLPVKTTPYEIYYSSFLDKYLWHNPEEEILLHPTSVLPGFYNEGSLIAPWGSLYPRYGIVTQFSQYKAAGVVALRAANIATESSQAHISIPAAGGEGACGDHCKIYKPVTVNNDTNARFQRIYPDMSHTFNSDDLGKNDLMSKDILKPFGQEWTEKGKNRYAFLIWRKYEGCMPSRGKVIQVIKS